VNKEQEFPKERISYTEVDSTLAYKQIDVSCTLNCIRSTIIQYFEGKNVNLNKNKRLYQNHYQKLKES